MHVDATSHFQVQFHWSEPEPAPTFEVKDLGPIEFYTLRITRRDGTALPGKVSGAGYRPGSNRYTTVKFKFEKLPQDLQDKFKSEWDKLVKGVQS